MSSPVPGSCARAPSDQRRQASRVLRQTIRRINSPVLAGCVTPTCTKTQFYTFGDEQFDSISPQPAIGSRRRKKNCSRYLHLYIFNGITGAGMDKPVDGIGLSDAGLLRHDNAPREELEPASAALAGTASSPHFYSVSLQGVKQSFVSRHIELAPPFHCHLASGISR